MHQNVAVHHQQDGWARGQEWHCSTCNSVELVYEKTKSKKKRTHRDVCIGNGLHPGSGLLSIHCTDLPHAQSAGARWRSKPPDWLSRLPSQSGLSTHTLSLSLSLSLRPVTGSLVVRDMAVVPGGASAVGAAGMEYSGQLICNSIGHRDWIFISTTSTHGDGTETIRFHFLVCIILHHLPVLTYNGVRYKKIILFVHKLVTCDLIICFTWDDVRNSFNLSMTSAQGLIALLRYEWIEYSLP